MNQRSQSQLHLPDVSTSLHDEEWIFSEDIQDEHEFCFGEHVTVMRDEIAQAMLLGAENAGSQAIIVDATLGMGGHSEAILELHPEVHVIGIDRDENARRAAKVRLERFGSRFRSASAMFSEVRRVLDDFGIDRVSGLCADLGVSSPQLDDPGRGMSFRNEGPIDMRMDQQSGETALDLIERLSDDELADVIYRYGDERKSRRIARSIKRAVQDGELHTTHDLRRAIVRATGPVRVGGIDPATRTFQALRIEVNQEISELKSLLASLSTVLNQGAIAAIISFHSLEDREVKRHFSDKSVWLSLSKKPVLPSDSERLENVRSRSAKLRVARFVGDSSWKG